VALAGSVLALVWFGYRATREWQRSAVQLVERRAAEVLALLAAGLNRDMKGTQVSVLVPINQEALQMDPPHDLRQVFARAFARFPYPESFFVWRETPTSGGFTYFFNRADRPPAWDPGPFTPDPYPVVLARNPAEPADLIARVRAQAVSGRTFALVETKIKGTPYQAVVHFFYQSSGSRRLIGLVGFTVNMDWVRESYFDPIVRQVARIGGDEEEMSLTIVNENGVAVSGNGVAARDDVVRERRFPLMFFDPDLLAALPPPRPTMPYWAARVAPGVEGALDDVAQGAGRTFLFISLAAVATVIGLVATARALRAAAELATMQSEFVSTVTHELKTPLASIRLISDTLARGRYSTPSTISDYARLLSDESERLRALIDNLLTFARVNDADKAYTFEAIDVLDLVEDVLEQAETRLSERAFEVVVDIPHELRVRVDRVAVMQVLGNLVDNAIKYSPAARHLAIVARRDGDAVSVAVADRGVGIPAAEIPRVFERFFRGRAAKAGGSGLGLTIARRVIRDHGGRISLRSTPGEGTVVTISLRAEASQ
jgi:signal transduction histidine kinase